MKVKTGIIVSAVALSTILAGSAATAVYADPQIIGITVVEERPTFVEEGATFSGTVVVAPADVGEYVFIDDGWYYYHPTLHVWVHAKHDKDWKPPAKVHVYHKWSEHPMYKRK